MAMAVGLLVGATGCQNAANALTSANQSSLASASNLVNQTAQPTSATPTSLQDPNGQNPTAQAPFGAASKDQGQMLDGVSSKDACPATASQLGLGDQFRKQNPMYATAGR
jgi:hypothetical protein